MTARPCGFKLAGDFRSEQTLEESKKTAGDAWTRSSARVSSIKPPEIAVGLCNALGLFGGRSPQTATNEHDTTNGGRTDE